MRWHRLGHLNKIKAKFGQKIKQGELVATMGKSGGNWTSHLHYDIFIQKPDKWTKYNIGWPKKTTLKWWTDPRPYEKIVMPTIDHHGYKWMQLARYSETAWCYHPGTDINGKGPGDADLDEPLYSPVDGTVGYVYGGSDKNNGWGRLIIIKENQMNEKEKKHEENVRAVLKHLGKRTGINIGKYVNDTERDNLIKWIKAIGISCPEKSILDKIRDLLKT